MPLGKGGLHKQEGETGTPH